MNYVIIQNREEGPVPMTFPATKIRTMTTFRKLSSLDIPNLAIVEADAESLESFKQEREKRKQARKAYKKYLNGEE